MAAIKLNTNQALMLQLLSRRPVDEYGNKATLKALATRGLAKRSDDNFGRQWVITDAGMELIGISKAQVEYNYAQWELKELEYEVRHNVWCVWKSYDGWRFEREWSKREMWRVEAGIANYQKAAARLCLAEMKLGLV